MNTKTKFSDKFKKIHQKIQRFEGRYANLKGDSGGETIQGISRNNFPKWEGWKFIDELKSQNLSIHEINTKTAENKEFQDLVTEFYFNEFYDNLGYSKFSFNLGLILTDSSVLYGKYRVAKNLQKIIKNYGQDIMVDGVLGKNSYKALDKVLETVSEQEIALALLMERLDDTLESVKYRESNKRFMIGWLNRIMWLYNIIK